ncbi:NlpC/P60 family protein [Curtobacterium flaccumfaciens pv. oortii]|uniref:C40 family peptidase n=1 Tax=Curtobacterium flaccumfaciens TaxID=2035 RepID=UPI002658362E|nr:C40 family peptidase [Curtobacterium flaccumfaciens]MCS5524685.1 NlpC/P60 family protein [Curtobacterium flaccumfaciens pv. oortii]
MNGKGSMIALVAIAPVVGIVVVVVLLFTIITGAGDDDAAAATCGASGAVSGTAVSVQSGDLPAKVGPYSGDQVKNAAAILSIGQQRGLTQHAQQTALMAAMTESTLNNLSGGDRDSAGLFQMRPSQGWGTHAQVTDISYAINLFYERLVKVPGWDSMSPGEAAQAVEGSAFPDAYATKAANAVEMMNALSGVTVSTVSQTTEGATCTAGAAAGAAAGGTNTALAAGEQPATGPHAAQINQVIGFAKQQLGKDYVLGGAGPNVWDCSGLTKVAYAQIGISIDAGHSATTQWRNGVASGHMHPLSEAQPGDLIFWGGNDAWHVGISLGGDMMIAAPKPGDVVKIQKVWGTPNSQVWRPVDAL